MTPDNELRRDLDTADMLLHNAWTVISAATGGQGWPDAADAWRIRYRAWLATTGHLADARDLVERSSLGTPAARAARGRVPAAVGEEIARRATAYANRGATIREPRSASPSSYWAGGILPDVPAYPNPTTLRGRDVPGWNGNIGPGPDQYGQHHVYARDPNAADNCICGRHPHHTLHVPTPTAPGGWTGTVLD